MEKQSWEIKCPYRCLSGYGKWWGCRDQGRLTDMADFTLKACDFESCRFKTETLHLYYITHDSKPGTSVYHFTSKLSYNDLPPWEKIIEILDIDYESGSIHEIFELHELVNKHQVECIDDKLCPPAENR